jgi:hypothetical protein
METTRIEELVGDLKDYASTRYKLSLLKAVDKTSTLGAKVWSAYIIAMVFFLGGAFIAAGAAYWLGKMTGSMIEGFLIVAGICLLKGILLILLRNSVLVKPIRDFIIKQIFNNGK